MTGSVCQVVGGRRCTSILTAKHFFFSARCASPILWLATGDRCKGISGLVAEYIVAIDVTRVRFPADAVHYSMIFRTLFDILLRPPVRPLAHLPIHPPHPIHAPMHTFTPSTHSTFTSLFASTGALMHTFTSFTQCTHLLSCLLQLVPWYTHSNHSSMHPFASLFASTSALMHTLTSSTHAHIDLPLCFNWCLDAHIHIIHPCTHLHSCLLQLLPLIHAPLLDNSPIRQKRKFFLDFLWAFRLFMVFPCNLLWCFPLPKK